jgi:hypothetical protein
MRPQEAQMDEMMRPREPDTDEAPAPPVSRRAFFNRARLAVLAVAGAAVFGVAISTSGATANEDDEDKEKEKKKSEPRDKDRDSKEKEQDKNGKSSEKKSNSNTKKKTKATNGDDKKKKKKQQDDPVANSPWGKYVSSGTDQYGCTDFKSQADAQAVLRLEPKDPNNLDRNKNGFACDGVDAFGDGVNAGLMLPPFDFNQVSRSQPTTSEGSTSKKKKKKNKP